MGCSGFCEFLCGQSFARSGGHENDFEERHARTGPQKQNRAVHRHPLK